MRQREATIDRRTAETQILLKLQLEGGEVSVETGVGFLDHMLELFARHGHMGLQVTCRGDVQVDDHHSVEDIGISLGLALAQAVGDKRGIHRYGSMLLPMDEALALVALDLSGRACLEMDCSFPTEKIGTFDTQLVEEFFLGMTRSAGMTLHIRKLAGRNSHHIAEAVFKGLGHALCEAVSMDERWQGQVPSSKGVLA